MNVMYVLLTIVYVCACLFLNFVVLIQKGEGGGLGGAFGGGAVDKAFGSQADMTWKRATAVAAALFMCLAILLGIMSSYRDPGGAAGAAARAAEATVVDDSEGTLEDTGEGADGGETETPFSGGGDGDAGGDE